MELAVGKRDQMVYRDKKNKETDMLLPGLEKIQVLKYFRQDNERSSESSFIFTRTF